jgi:hypothetical protein
MNYVVIPAKDPVTRRVTYHVYRASIDRSGHMCYGQVYQSLSRRDANQHAARLNQPRSK